MATQGIPGLYPSNFPNSELASVYCCTQTSNVGAHILTFTWDVLYPLDYLLGPPDSLNVHIFDMCERIQPFGIYL